MNAKTKPMVVTTGGRGGVGLGIAQAFAHRGARPAISGRNRESLAAAARAPGNETGWFLADVSRRRNAARGRHP